MDVLDHLIEEHRTVEHLLDGLGSVLEPDERERQVGHLEAVLRMHLAVEQRFVAPLVAHEAPEDHDRRDALLGPATGDALAALRSGEDGDVDWAVDVLRGGLHDHAHETEDHLFPRLRAAAAARYPELSDPEPLRSEIRQDRDRDKADRDNEAAEQLYLSARRAGPGSASPA